MFSLQNKRVLLVSLYIFCLLFMTSQARNMPKETTTPPPTKGVDEKLVKTTENLAVAPTSTTEKVVEKGVTRTENDQHPTGFTTTEAGKGHDDKMVARTENMAPTSTEDLNMMDYSAAQNKNPSHN